jgi:hypothetical protein
VASQYFRFIARGAASHRAPLLERLLARADGWEPVADWRADAFRVIAPRAAVMPAVAAAALRARVATPGVETPGVATPGEATPDVQAAWICVATPVHYTAEMSNVRLPADGMLAVSAAEAETLAEDFNRVWQGSGIHMTAPVGSAPGRSAQLFCVFDRALEVVTRDPEDVLGRQIEEFLPTGADSARLRQLISETEMWLFEHEANRARTRSGLPVINGLWLWGGGAPVASLPALQGWAAGDDLFFSAFSTPRDEKFQSGVAAVDCVPGSDRWPEVESRWLRPAIAQLRAGRIEQLRVSAQDRCFTVTGRALRRFWRRTKPWWESFE